MDWLKKNWIIALIVIIIVGFIAVQGYSMNSQISALSSSLEEKIDEINGLKTEVSNLEKNIESLNTEISITQEEMRKTTALFWTKFNKIKVESQNQTPEQVLEGWKNSWPGGTK